MFQIADGHCDFLYGAANEGYNLDAPKKRQNITAAHLLDGGVRLQFFAAWIDMSLHIPPLQQCLAMIDAYYEMHDQHPWLLPLTPSARMNNDTGKVFTVLTVEGGEAIEGSLAVLRVLHRLGVRAMSLTWNDNNELAGAALARGNHGLTPLGCEVVAEMNRIGMAIDVSHLSDAGIDDVLRLSTRPVFASHSNARAVFPSPRSLSDEHIRAIAACGGTVGVNFYNKQLTRNVNACIDDIVRQIEHICAVGGVACCAIGSDFDGMPVYPRDLATSRDFPMLADALLHAGFSKDEVNRILFENLYRFILQFV